LLLRCCLLPGRLVHDRGAFTRPRNYLAELNATTNTYIPTWAPVVDAGVRALETDTSQMGIVEGGFQQSPTGSGCDGRIGIGAVNTTEAGRQHTLFAAGTGNGGTALSV
jgi:hypothetical protein